MQFEVIFSTYNNKTKKQATTKQLEADLVKLAKQYDLPGFSLSHQLGYWAGELEQSHILTLLDIDKARAFDIAEAIKTKYAQQAVIVRPVEQINYFI
jgi:hypothetical protein